MEEGKKEKVREKERVTKREKMTEKETKFDVQASLNHWKSVKEI